MSAFEVSRAHIDVVVTALADRGLLCDHEDCQACVELAESCSADAVGQTLVDENTASVNYRYREDTPAPSYTYTRRVVDVHAALKAVRCLAYQSCEHEAWEVSRACALLVALENALTFEGASSKSDAYAAAPWGYEDEHFTA